MKTKIVVYSKPGSLFTHHKIFTANDERVIRKYIDSKVLAGMECQLFEQVAVFNLTKQVQEKR